jgi:hypothetical protein
MREAVLDLTAQQTGVLQIAAWPSARGKEFLNALDDRAAIGHEGGKQFDVSLEGHHHRVRAAALSSGGRKGSST